MREYETDRWRIISTKVGSGFSPAACKEKAVEIIDHNQQQVDLGDIDGGVDDLGDQDQDSSYDQTRPESASSEVPPSYQ
jgi:hypothetical protein